MNKNYFDENRYRKLLDNTLDSRAQFVVPEASSSEVTDIAENEVFSRMLNELNQHSIPWHNSKQYFGHMNYSVLPIAAAAQFATSLYNPNNVTSQSSPITSRYEQVVVREFSDLIGYGEQSSGHMMSGGTSGNYESLLVAKLMKQVVFATYANPETRHFLPPSVLERSNMRSHAIAELMDKLNQVGKLAGIIKAAKGEFAHTRGKVIIPETAHYSLQDACVKASIPLNDIVTVQVNDKFQIDQEDLKKTVEQCIQEGTPIIAIAAIMGTTEAGSIDPLHEIVTLRNEMEENYNASFYIHLDAAFGGYLKTAIVGSDGSALSYDAVVESGVKMTKANYDALMAMQEADSVIIDPHKQGYIPYGSCVLAFKHKKYLAVLSKEAAYVFEHDEENPSLGVSSIEGSRPGAAAAAVYAANKMLPLNQQGYGKLLVNTINSAQELVNRMLDDSGFVVDGRYFNIVPVSDHIDFNAVLYAVVEKGGSLEACNKLNHQIFERCHYVGVGEKPDLFLAPTALSTTSMRRSIMDFSQRCGYTQSELNTQSKIQVLRGIMMDPTIGDSPTVAEFWEILKSQLAIVTAEIVKQQSSIKAA